MAKTSNVRLRQDLYDELDRIARSEKGVSRVGIVKEAVERWLEARNTEKGIGPTPRRRSPEIEALIAWYHNPPLEDVSFRDFLAAKLKASAKIRMRHTDYLPPKTEIG